MTDARAHESDNTALQKEASRLQSAIAEVNKLIDKEIRTPTSRCRNYFARIEKVRAIIAALNPQLNELIGARTNLENSLATVANDIPTAQKASADTDAAIQGLQRQLAERNGLPATQLASLDEKIKQRMDRRAAALEIQEEKENEYAQFRETNSAALDAIFDLLLQENRPPLSAAQQELVDKRKSFEAQIDFLNEQVLGLARIFREKR